MDNYTKLNEVLKEFTNMTPGGGMYSAYLKCAHELFNLYKKALYINEMCFEGEISNEEAENQLEEVLHKAERLIG